MLDPDFTDAFPQISQVVSVGIERGLHTGCQIYVSRFGRTLINQGLGESRPGASMTNETINLWLSSGKPLTAVLILQAWERSELRLDDPVVDFIPEFAAEGKQSVTIRHLLTHTAGIRHVETGWPDVSWEESIRRICASEIEAGWIVGRTPGYHTTSSWFILAEILQRITKQRFEDVLQQRLLRPIGMSDTRIAMTEDQRRLCGDRLGGIFAREQGELRPLDWNDGPRAAVPSPGGGLRGPIRELGLFYEMLMHEGISAGGRIVTPQSVDTLTARHRVGDYDLTLGHVVDFGLGVIIDSNRYGAETVPYGYGRHCSPRAFGHGGAQSSQGWCDPETGLVVAWYFNGRAGEAQHNRRTRQLNDAIAADIAAAGR